MLHRRFVLFNTACSLHLNCCMYNSAAPPCAASRQLATSPPRRHIAASFVPSKACLHSVRCVTQKFQRYYLTHSTSAVPQQNASAVNSARASAGAAVLLLCHCIFSRQCRFCRCLSIVLSASTSLRCHTLLWRNKGCMCPTVKFATPSGQCTQSTQSTPCCTPAVLAAVPKLYSRACAYKHKSPKS